MKQLDVSDQFISNPTIIKNDKIRFNLFKNNSEYEMEKQLQSICDQHYHEKTMIFVKSDEVAKKVFSILDNRYTLLFATDDYDSLDLFVSEKSNLNVMICSYDLGIGLDFRNVKNIIHYGIPYSKMDFFQQIGRAGRDGSYCVSYVIYLDKEKCEKYLLKRNIPYLGLFKKLQASPVNDYSLSYLNLFSSFIGVDYNACKFSEILTLIKNEYKKNYLSVKTELLENYTSVYILQKIGIVDYWGVDEEQLLLCINERIDLSIIKNNFRNYMRVIGNDLLNADITHINDIDILANLFYETFIENYIEIKKNQLLDVIDMLDKYSNQSNISQELNKDFERYFLLPFVSILDLEEKIMESTFEDINYNFLFDTYFQEKLYRIERIDASSPKINYLKLLCKLSDDKFIDAYDDRLIQIIKYLNGHEITNIF